MPAILEGGDRSFCRIDGAFEATEGLRAGTLLLGVNRSRLYRRQARSQPGNPPVVGSQSGVDCRCARIFVMRAASEPSAVR